MKRLALPLFLVLVIGNVLAQTRERTEVPEAFTWRLTDLYPSDEAFQQARDKTIAESRKIDGYRDKLGESPKTLLEFLELMSNVEKEFGRLMTYASLHAAQDTRDSKRLAMAQELESAAVELESRTAFMAPEIESVGRQKIEQFIQQEPKLKVYKQPLDDILRRAEHTGTPGEERIIAAAGLIGDAGGDIFGVFSNADFPYPEIQLSDGKKVKLDQAGFSLYRTLPNRDDRMKVFKTFMGKLHDFRRTFGTQLHAGVKRDFFYAKARNYQTRLDSALDENAIPVEVYHTLVKNVNAGLPTFHRYLKLRQRMMGLDQLHYYDLYAPLVPGADLKYSIEEAQKIILASLTPMGTQYVDVVRKAFAERWIDVYPTPGKRSGAFSSGNVYDVHPYILMNYNGLFTDVSTLTHELGHTMHSYLSNTNQPYPTADYPIFLAEVASTFNEALLMDHMLKTIKDDKVRLSLLGNYLEGIKATVFRQGQFAEFELKIHEVVEKGEALTGDKLGELYLDVTRKYYGHDAKVCVVDDEIQSEWSFIPHFYYNYYVYQYATAYTASSALSEKVMAGDAEAKKRYLELLTSGGSDYPIELLKKAGVDMTTSQPFELTLKKMNRVMDEMEQILDKQGGTGSTTQK